MESPFVIVQVASLGIQRVRQLQVFSDFVLMGLKDDRKRVWDSLRGAGDHAHFKNPLV